MASATDTKTMKTLCLRHVLFLLTLCGCWRNLDCSDFCGATPSRLCGSGSGLLMWQLLGAVFLGAIYQARRAVRKLRSVLMSPKQRPQGSKGPTVVSSFVIPADV